MGLTLTQCRRLLQSPEGQRLGRPLSRNAAKKGVDVRAEGTHGQPGKEAAQWEQGRAPPAVRVKPGHVLLGALLLAQPGVRPQVRPDVQTRPAKPLVLGAHLDPAVKQQEDLSGLQPGLQLRDSGGTWGMA